MVSANISIIIPAHNCAKHITRTLDTVLTARKDYLSTVAGEDRRPVVEIIVVDDGSMDQTKDEIAKYPAVKYLFQKNAGPAVARNLGAKNATGEILFFTDSDCLPHADWIQLMMPHFQKPNVAVVAGSYGIANPQVCLSRCIHREIIYRHMMRMPEYPSYFGSFNFAVRREVFEKVGGFDPAYRHASGEDNDLSYQIASRGYRIYFAKDALVDHFHPEQLREYLREQYRHGYWRVQMYRRHPRMVRGDGYTFWKDIAEVGLVLFFYISWILVFLGFFAWGAWTMMLSVLALLAVNIFFAIQMIAEWKAGLFFADVMILRAFARTNGFLSGCVSFLIKPERK